MQIKEVEGGILFVDEGYRLMPMQKADDKDYGLKALEEIMSVMDSGKVVGIFAGYGEPMFWKSQITTFLFQFLQITTSTNLTF